jgi:hypothetical protein
MFMHLCVADRSFKTGMTVGVGGAVLACAYKFIRDEGLYFSTVLPHPGHKVQAPYLGKHFFTAKSPEPQDRY